VARPWPLPELRGRDAGAGDGGGDAAALAEAAVREAWDRGRVAGRAEGEAALRARWAPRLAEAIRALEGAARDLERERAALATALLDRVPVLVATLARKVLHRELPTAEACARATLQAVLARAATLPGVARVRVAPQVLEALAAEGVATGVRLEPDPALSGADWILETDDARLDGRLEAQLDEAWRLLSEAAP
jgi:flagellar biosynthesis/type III secretory pathway protein FliH